MMGCINTVPVVKVNVEEGKEKTPKDCSSKKEKKGKKREGDYEKSKKNEKFKTRVEVKEDKEKESEEDDGDSKKKDSGRISSNSSSNNEDSKKDEESVVHDVVEELEEEEVLKEIESPKEEAPEKEKMEKEAEEDKVKEEEKIEEKEGSSSSSSSSSGEELDGDKPEPAEKVAEEEAEEGKAEKVEEEEKEGGFERSETGLTCLNDKEYVLNLVKGDGCALRGASEELRNDKEVVLEAVKHDWKALEYASKELQSDKEVVMEAVERNGFALQYASEELNDKEVVLESVKKCGLTLQYANEELRNDKEVVLAAVKAVGSALVYAGEELKNDKVVVLEALKQTKLAFRFAGKELVKECNKSGGYYRPMDWLLDCIQKEKKEAFENQLEEERKRTDSVKNENQKILDSVLDSVGRRFRIPHNQLRIHREGKLGKGGFGSVFKADWTNEQGEKKEVAVKVIGYGLQDNAKEVFKEFSRSLQFRDEHVIRTFGFDDSRRNEIAIVMEKLDGNMHDYVRENILTLEEKLDIMLKMTKGIKYLHNMEPNPFIHRDIKGENFLFKFGEDGELLDVKVCDFGLAKATTGTETQVSAAGQGTKLWMAPEAGKGLYSVKSDVYSLAVSFWEILFEEYPYGELDPNHVFYKVEVDGLRPDLNKYEPEKKNNDEEDEGEVSIEDGSLPTELKKLLESCWNGDRKKRPTIQDLVLWFDEEGTEIGMEYGEEYFPPLEVQEVIRKKEMGKKAAKQKTQKSKQGKGGEKEKKQKLLQFRDLKEKGKLKAFVFGQNCDGLLSACSDGISMISELKKEGFKCTKELYKGEEERLITPHKMKKSFRRFVKTLEEDDRVVFYFSGYGFEREGRNYLLCAKDEDDDEVIDRVVELTFFIKELWKAKTENIFILDHNEMWEGTVGEFEPIKGGRYTFGFTCTKKRGGSVVTNEFLKYKSKEENPMKKATVETLEGNDFFMGDVGDWPLGSTL